MQKTAKDRLLKLKEVDKTNEELKQLLEKAGDAILVLGNMVPTNPCNVGWCACSGACRKQEVKDAFELLEKISNVVYEE